MPQFINSNIASLTAQRNLNTSQSALTTSLERLSSGLRINSAKDDAAGLAISERFTSQIRGLNQAQRNANDGISLAQTAEGDLAAITNNLQRIRELSVQSANATNSATDRAALQSEVTQLTEEINRVAEQSAFNGVNLLDGSFTSKAFQVGANAGQTVSIDSIVDARSSSLGSHTLLADGSITGNTATAAATAATNSVSAETDLTITTADGGTTSAISYAANASATDIATAINSAANNVGVTATASNSTTLNSFSAAGTFAMDINGSSLSGIVVADQNDLTAVVNAINGVQGTTGVTATFTDSTNKSGITLSTTDGRDIRLENFTSGTLTSSFGGATLTSGGTADSSIVTGTVSLASSQGQITLANASTEVFAGATDTSSFASVAGVDVSSATGASAALATIDAALGMVNSGRADLGAIQNRFDSVVSSIQTTSENLSASRSRISDTDFAAETAALTRAQILQQAGVSMLSQANSLPQGVLALLQ